MIDCKFKKVQLSLDRGTAVVQTQINRLKAQQTPCIYADIIVKCEASFWTELLSKLACRGLFRGGQERSGGALKPAWTQSSGAKSGSVKSVCAQTWTRWPSSSVQRGTTRRGVAATMGFIGSINDLFWFIFHFYIFKWQEAQLFAMPAQLLIYAQNVVIFLFSYLRVSIFLMSHKYEVICDIRVIFYNNQRKTLPITWTSVHFLKIIHFIHTERLMLA